MPRARNHTCAQYRLPGKKNPSIRKALSSGRSLLGYKLPNLSEKSIGFNTRRDEMYHAARNVLEPALTSNPEAHEICIGPTGSGKGRASLIPKLLSWQGSVVVIDPKGEAAEVTARYRKEVLGQEVIMLDPFGLNKQFKSDQLNPLDSLKISGDTIENFSLSMPGVIHPDHTNYSKDPFWDNKADEILSAVTCAVLTTFPKAQCTFGKIADMLYNEDPITNLKLYLYDYKDKLPQLAINGISSLLSSPENTRGSIFSVAQQHLKIFNDPDVRHALSRTTFDLKAFQQGKPTTIYLILPVTKLKSHGVLLRIWLACLLGIAFGRRHQLKHKTYFLVDEMSHLGAIEDLNTAFTLARAYSIKLCIYLQDLQQLKALYPNSWNTILGNAGSIQFFTPRNYMNANEIAGLFGKDLEADKLLNLPNNRQIVLNDGGRWEESLKLDYLKDPFFNGKFDDNRLHQYIHSHS